jgi:hypothetical protein
MDFHDGQNGIYAVTFDQLSKRLRTIEDAGGGSRM